MSSLIRKCPDCGATVWPRMKFCGQCGHKMEAADVSEGEDIPPVMRDELLDELNHPGKKASGLIPDLESRTPAKSFLIGAIAGAAVLVLAVAIFLIAQTNRPVARKEQTAAAETADTVHVITTGESAAPKETPVEETEPPETPAPTETSEPSGEISREPEGPDLVYVIPAGLNLRAGPGTEYDIVDAVEEGTALERIGTEDDWTRILYDGIECYVLSSLVTDGSPDDEDDATPATATPEPAETTNTPDARPEDDDDDPRGIVVAISGANVRTGPGTEYNVIDTVDAGKEMRTTGSTDGWSRVEYDGRTGYISDSLLDIIRPAQTAGGRGTAQEPTPAPEESFWISITGKVNVRTGPGTRYDILGAVEYGDWLQAFGQEGSWYVVSYDGQRGYIPTDMAQRDD